MEVPGASDHKLIVCIYEFVASAFLLYVILLGGSAVGVTFVVFILILATGPVSGGHFNPAITIGVYITRKEYKKNFALMILMIIFQLAGGIAGTALAWS